MSNISFAATEKKINQYDFLNKLLECFADGVRKETLKSFA